MISIQSSDFQPGAATPKGVASRYFTYTDILYYICLILVLDGVVAL